MTPVSKRINNDVMKLLMKDFKLHMINEDNMQNFFIELHGPQETAYQGYFWHLRVELPADYPYERPFIHFADSIFHPNIDYLLGGICLDVLNESWSPMADLVAVFEQYIPQLLRYPNPEHPINSEAADLLLQDPASYEQRVREHCEMHAIPEEIAIEESDEEETEEWSEDEMVPETDEKIEKQLAVVEDKDDNAQSDKNNVAGKVDE